MKKQSKAIGAGIAAAFVVVLAEVAKMGGVTLSSELTGALTVIFAWGGAYFAPKNAD